LYRLHWSPEIATENGDTTTYVFVNDAVVGYGHTLEDSKLWKSIDNMLVAYPGTSA